MHAGILHHAQSYEEQYAYVLLHATLLHTKNQQLTLHNTKSLEIKNMND